MSDRVTPNGIPLSHGPREVRTGGRSSGMGRGVHGFWVKIDTRNPDGCWSWTGYLDKDGYGKFCTTVAGHVCMLRPHRHAWKQQHGPIEKKKMLMHLCDNHTCYNPTHL